MAKKAREMNFRERPLLAPGTIERLQAYHWPGNVRELENLVERTLLRGQADSPDKPLRFETLHSGISEAGIEPAADASERPLLLDDAMRQHIGNVLKVAKEKVQEKTGAAALLGVNPSTLRNRMKKLGIPYGRNDTSLAGAEILPNLVLSFLTDNRVIPIMVDSIPESKNCILGVFTMRFNRFPPQGSTRLRRYICSKIPMYRAAVL